MSSTFVLVHGAWHGGWCWQRVLDALRARQHVAFAPTLSGLAERAGRTSADVDLHTHVDDVVAFITSHKLRDVVLVGHSYGGCVIAGVVEEIADLVRSIVFVDAFVPEHGQCQLDWASERRRREIHEQLARGADVIDPPPATALCVNERDRPWVDVAMTPMPIRTFTSTLALNGAVDRIPKRSYIRATGFPSDAFDDAYDRAKRRRGWLCHEVPSGHDVMIDAPERLTELLIELA